MAGEFKVGNVVQLKSGGELMTVTRIYDNGTIGTNWQSGGKNHEGEYPADALELYQEPSQSDLEPE